MALSHLQACNMMCSFFLFGLLTPHYPCYWALVCTSRDSGTPIFDLTDRRGISLRINTWWWLWYSRSLFSVWNNLGLARGWPCIRWTFIRATAHAQRERQIVLIATATCEITYSSFACAFHHHHPPPPCTTYRVFRSVQGCPMTNEQALPGVMRTMVRLFSSGQGNSQVC